MESQSVFLIIDDHSIAYSFEYPQSYTRTHCSVDAFFSLGAVLAAVLGIIPQSALPSAPTTVIELIPHLNAIISAIEIITILFGVRFIRHGDVRRHRAMMVTSVGLFILFLVFIFIQGHYQRSSRISRS